MFFWLAFLIFAGALYAAGYYLWTVPERQAADILGARLRELRANVRARTKGQPELLRQQRRGTFAALGDIVAWIGVLRRLHKFEEQLPDAIDLFTRTMRAGHNIHSGLETMANETLDPIKMEFKKVMEELALGSPLEPTLHNLGGRVPLIDLKFFITGLILQRQTGANMVAVLENLATLVRERLNMAAKLKAHTAQQRFSAGLLCGMPLVVALGFWILKPEYIRLLYTDPTGSKFLTYAIISECVGILVIRKIANIRV